jgi:hypothetical protein
MKYERATFWKAFPVLQFRKCLSFSRTRCSSDNKYKLLSIFRSMVHQFWCAFWNKLEWNDIEVCDRIKMTFLGNCATAKGERLDGYLWSTVTDRYFSKYWRRIAYDPAFERVHENVSLRIFSVSLLITFSSTPDRVGIDWPQLLNLLSSCIPAYLMEIWHFIVSTRQTRGVIHSNHAPSSD